MGGQGSSLIGAQARPWWFSDSDSGLPQQGAQVGYLVLAKTPDRELRSEKGNKTKQNKTKQNKTLPTQKKELKASERTGRRGWDAGSSLEVSF